jgi:hypothetical protein
MNKVGPVRTLQCRRRRIQNYTISSTGTVQLVRADYVCLPFNAFPPYILVTLVTQWWQHYRNYYFVSMHTLVCRGLLYKRKSMPNLIKFSITIFLSVKVTIYFYEKIYCRPLVGEKGKTKHFILVTSFIIAGAFHIMCMHYV